jgi:hypothetical protein
MKIPKPVKIKTHTKPPEDASAATIRATTRGLVYRTKQQESLGPVYRTAPQIKLTKVKK